MQYRLDYCNSLFVGMTDCNFKKLQRVQITLARVVLRAGAGKFEHIADLLFLGFIIIILFVTVTEHIKRNRQ